ncbi:MAG: phage baseplate assembly protein V [Cyanobacteriota bacterium]|nr:phage baseplate assembly protein V [Cyanobacteriota bacterium]
MDFFDQVFAEQNRERRERSVQGIVVALVTGRMEDGRYELRFLSMGGNAPSAPARMMMPNAGHKRGMYWMPEIGDEVVVGFENGDSNAPIILGALFNAVSPVPDQVDTSGSNNVRTIVSRSGHEITLDDAVGSEKITVKTSGGRTLRLDDTPAGKIVLETPLGLTIELDDGTGTLTMKAPLALKLESPGTIQLKASAILLTTNGSMPTSAVLIDGQPFGLHVHGLPPPIVGPPPTPPVLPLTP